VPVRQCLNGRAPPYLSGHYIPVSSADTRQHLRSTNRHLLAIPRFPLNTYGRTRSRATSASSVLGVLNDYALYKSTHSTRSLPHIVRVCVLHSLCPGRVLETAQYIQWTRADRARRRTWRSLGGGSTTSVCAVHATSPRCSPCRCPAGSPRAPAANHSAASTSRDHLTRDNPRRTHVQFNKWSQK